MLIDSIEIYLVENSFYSPWRTAYGSDAGNMVVITRMTSGAHEGWSESSPLPCPNYSYEYGEGAFHVAKKFLAPLIVGKDVTTAREMNSLMSAVKGNPFAKAALEMAWWTLAADIAGVPLGNLIGSKSRRVEVGSGIGVMDDYDSLIRKIDRTINDGYRRVKLKMMRGWDYDMLAAVRSAFPDITLHVDCNASYAPEDTPLFESLDRFHLAMIEQPFAPGDIYAHSVLQKKLDTPICLDESITEVWQAEQAAELRACRYINIKPARVGGIQNAIDINEVCRLAGIGCWVGGMLESDVGKAICVELAALGNMVYPHDITPATESYPARFTRGELRFVDSCYLNTTSAIGTPIKPDIELMTPMVRRSIHFDKT